MINPHRVKFQKIFSNELNIPDLIMECAFESDNSEVSTYLNRESVSVESHDGRHNNTILYKYNERFSPRFTFMKKGFGDFDSSELRSVLKWLTSSDTPTLLDVYYDDSNVVGFSAVGNWTEISSYKLSNSRTVAVVATFEAVHPFALSDLYTVTKTISSATNNKITIEIDTDDNKPVYPRITIEHNGSVVNIPSETTFSNILDMADRVENTAYYNGATYYWKTSESVWRSAAAAPNYDGWTTVEVTRAYTEGDTYARNTFYHYADGNMYYWIDPYSFHSSDKNPNLQTTSVKIINQHYDFFNQASTPVETVVKNNTPTEKIVVDGANKIISSDRTRRIFGDDFVDWQWLPLYDGKNEIIVEGNCEVTLEYRCIRKVGEF